MLIVLLAAVASARDWESVAPPVGNGVNGELYAVDISPVDGTWWAVGTTGQLFDDKDTWVSWYDGVWNSLPTLPNGPFPYDELSDVAVGEWGVWVVGTSYEFDYLASTGVALAAVWDGAGWWDTPLSDPGHLMHVLEGIDGVAGDDLWAVGTASDSSSDPTAEAVAHHWDGAEWTRIALPQPSSWSELVSVVALASDDVWAVGMRGDAALSGCCLQQTHPTPFAVHWDGVVWTEIPLPPGGKLPELRSVSGSSGDDVWAVGDVMRNVGGVSVRVPLAAHWDGAAWAIVPTPLVGAIEHHLQAVVAPSPEVAFAVGYTVDATASPSYRTLVQRWDGARWRIRASDDPYDYRNELWGVDADGLDAVAVGIGTTIAADADPALVLAP